MEPLKQLLREHALDAARIRTKLITALMCCPDNPKIQRIGSGCFVLPSSDLADNWSPFFYDFKLQYRAIIRKIAGRELESIIKRLGKMIETGKIELGAGFGRYKEALAPEVVSTLREVVGHE